MLLESRVLVPAQDQVRRNLLSPGMVAVVVPNDVDGAVRDHRNTSSPVERAVDCCRVLCMYMQYLCNQRHKYMHVDTCVCTDMHVQR